ncbi:MAG: maleylpyruvate isomerase N-terminal domain-containing protein [Roseibium sp.]|uniref:maleylpyruvate isomerase N-terminal domain-containing protein n=1 Tax=Roseibium sp. TaxID=1936156 RepID=UPI0032669B3D|tara:strand:- start:393 stop:944 length:552 start_codon:yes stop_codon:yes gene_type:complete
MTPGDTAARDALRARQGDGARYDAEAAPHDDLLQARRGTAYFARKLNELSDAELLGPALRDGWTRAQLVAHISYHARLFAHLLEAARTGISQPIAENRDTEIGFGTTLPPHALRSLFRHAEVHLNVEWRDLTDKGWSAPLRLPDGAAITARETPILRAKEVWQGAIDLGNGAGIADVPHAVLG